MSPSQNPRPINWFRLPESRSLLPQGPEWKQPELWGAFVFSLGEDICAAHAEGSNCSRGGVKVAARLLRGDAKLSLLKYTVPGKGCDFAVKQVKTKKKHLITYTVDSHDKCKLSGVVLPKTCSLLLSFFLPCSICEGFCVVTRRGVGNEQARDYLQDMITALKPRLSEGSIQARSQAIRNPTTPVSRKLDSTVVECESV